ncbi:MAG: RIP metalloprotease RseP [Ruminococcaceae bacterium]|nr:RIP metalloprotease RseP [Oscillospiraceae bacterium]
MELSMQNILSFLGYLLLTVFMLGILIFVHELGHYIVARLCRVTIHEFSIGMGKRLFGFKSKKTGIEYNLRLFPIGGFVAMAGEDEEVDDPNAFNKKNVWQRIAILVAGAGMNILIGFLSMLILVGGMTLDGYKLPSTQIGQFAVGSSSYVTGLEVGDTVLKVDGVNVHTGYDLAYEIMNSGYQPVDVTVVRDGKTVLVPDVIFPVTVSGSTAFGDMDFSVVEMKASFGNVVKSAYFRSVSTVKMVFDSVGGLITGRYGAAELSGPIGVTSTVSDMAQSQMPVWNLLYLFAVIAINLGVMNLLPIPAIDGGRLFFRIIEILRFGRPVKPELEAKIHGIGMMLLLVAMVVIAFKDVFALF